MYPFDWMITPDPALAVAEEALENPLFLDVEVTVMETTEFSAFFTILSVVRVVFELVSL